MSADLAIVVPVLARPSNVAPLMESIRATTPDARTVFVCDPDDLDERRAVLEAGAEFFVIAGSYARKVQGVVRGTSEPLLFLAADDLSPHSGWFEAARARLVGDVQAVGVNDGIERPRRPGHATHFLLTREYAERPTIDDQPGPMSLAYDHSFCDDEFIATAKRRGVYAYAQDAFVEHVGHPMTGGEDDATYRKGRERFREDRRLFRQRSALWA